MFVGRKINGTWQHFVLGVGLVFLSLALHKMIWPAIYVLLTVELVQADVFGWRNLLKLDTWHDLLIDALGGIIGWAVWWLAF